MTAGLRRFARAPGATAGPDVPGMPGQDATSGPVAERCEMCGTPLDERHSHLVDLQARSLTCACRACYLLFTAPGAGRGRYRAVPGQVHHEPDTPLSDADWDALQVPVGTAFFFVNSDLGRIVGCYPSPGGATECELDLAAWDRLVQRHPMFGSLDPDVQAIYVTRGPEGIETFLVPIDACYELVGRVRLRWRGLDGGDEARATFSDFLDDLRSRSTPWAGRGAR
jgi:hypothetical protein